MTLGLARTFALPLVSALALLAAVLPAWSARRPHFGGTLRVDVGAVVNSLDPAVAASDPAAAEAEAQIESLLYDRSGATSSQPAPGAFRISAWDPGKSVALTANEDYRGGRPFVDSIEIVTARSPRDRLLDLELGKADVAEIPPDQARRATDGGVRVSVSRPDELLALVFGTASAAAQDATIRRSIASSMDRVSMVSVIFQKTGEPASSLLPQWSSGTAFLFSASGESTGPQSSAAASPSTSASSAQEPQPQIAGSPALVLGYDSADILEQSVAERIVVIARESGIAIAARPFPPSQQSSPAAVPTGFDGRLVRWTMPSPHPREALAGFLTSFPDLASAAQVLPAALPASASAQDVYELQRKLLADSRIIPLVWLPHVYGLSSRVRDWSAPAPGEGWPLADVWLAGDAQ